MEKTPRKRYWHYNWTRSDPRNPEEPSRDRWLRLIGSNFVRYWLEQHPESRVVLYDKLTYAGRKENLHDLWGKPNLSYGTKLSSEDVESKGRR